MGGRLKNKRKDSWSLWMGNVGYFLPVCLTRALTVLFFIVVLYYSTTRPISCVVFFGSIFEAIFPSDFPIFSNRTITSDRTDNGAASALIHCLHSRHLLNPSIDRSDFVCLVWETDWVFMVQQNDDDGWIHLGNWTGLCLFRCLISRPSSGWWEEET